jgi:hypothetical protein
VLIVVKTFRYGVRGLRGGFLASRGGGRAGHRQFGFARPAVLIVGLRVLDVGLGIPC